MAIIAAGRIVRFARRSSGASQLSPLRQVKLRNMAGGDANSVRGFIARELFEPLGFEHATLEYDSAGVPLGTIHLWASARDWARFGLLYLRDGVAESGRRILPEGWVDYSAEFTPQSANDRHPL